jgi:hypothetical protein
MPIVEHRGDNNLRDAAVAEFEVADFLLVDQTHDRAEAGDLFKEIAALRREDLLYLGGLHHLALSVEEAEVGDARRTLNGRWLRADFFADRFGQLSSQLDLVQEQTQQDLESSINQINTLTDQIAKVNTQLAKQKIETAQPPDLLDQRDLLLKQLSVFVRINTRFEVNGIVTVSAGPTINADILVNNQKSFMIQANFDSASTEKVALVLDPYGNASSLSRITSGSLSGILAFRAQVLGGSRTALDGLRDGEPLPTLRRSWRAKPCRV